MSKLIAEMIASGYLVITPTPFNPTYCLPKQPPVTAERLAEIDAACKRIKDYDDDMDDRIAARREQAREIREYQDQCDRESQI